MAPSVVFIDLTQCDDEDRKTRDPVRNRSPSTLPLPIPQHSPSRHDSLPKTTRIIPERYRTNGSYALNPSRRTLGTVKVSIRATASTHNPSPQHINGAASQRQPDQGRNPNLEYAVKRRKLQNGAIHPLFHASQNSAPRAQGDAKKETAVHGTVLESGDSKDHPVGRTEEIRRVLERQVFPYIREGVSKHRGKLSSLAADAIGQKVRRLIAGDLVNTPAFMQTLRENNFKLSAKFEKQLALRAKSLVDRYTTLALDGLGIDELKLLDTPDQSYVASDATAFNDSRLNLGSSANFNSTVKTLEEKAVAAHKPRLHHPKSRSHSSSSSAPASSPNFKATALEDTETTDHSSSTTPITNPRSTRNLRSFECSTPQPIIPAKLGSAANPHICSWREDIQSHSVFDTSLGPVHRRSENPFHATGSNRTRYSRHQTSRSLLPRLLRERELTGVGGIDFCRNRVSFRTKAANYLEDSLVLKSHWTNCSGDIATISWAGEGAFVCGAIAHSDDYNMQYNKPGNLTFGSLPLETLKAVAEHRVVRPVVDPGRNRDNASDAMRQTQDPWLYTSVVSSSYSETTGLTFTASFDKTVKVWTVSEDGSSMTLVGNWPHEDKVNFVVTSQVHDRVATAADVYNNAIRVYDLHRGDVANSPYYTYSGAKAMEQAREVRAQDNWAYFPATIQWGKSPSVANLILVGYSPRSVRGDDADIPDDKRNSGELCIWNVKDQSRGKIHGGQSQNVFEVVWHPSQPCFLAATSPCGDFEPEKTRTQVRLFGQNEDGEFVVLSTLDCPALDINELTIMANSKIYCYVTASCTDGNTYVWDTARGDKPIHVLNHGESLDDPVPDLPREIGDAGVKFAAWGQTCERLYTGSSDGKVNSWDVKAPPGKAFVRNVLEVSGGISSGAFSGDFSKLLIGDATGKVHLLAFDNSDVDVETSLGDPSTVGLGASLNTVLAGTSQRPKLVIPHPNLPPPSSSGKGPNNISSEEESGPEIAHDFLVEGKLVLYPDPLVGAIQGPRYHETSFFRAEAHEEDDVLKPLRNGFRASQKFELPIRPESLGHLQLLPAMCLDLQAHFNNLKLESYFRTEGIELEWDYRFIEDID